MPNSRSTSSSDGDADLTTSRGRGAAFRARFPGGRVEVEARLVRGGAAVHGVATAWRTPDDQRPVRVELTLRTVGASDAIREGSLARVRELVTARALAELLRESPAAPPPPPPTRQAARVVREPAVAAAAAAAASFAGHLDPHAAQVAALLEAARRAGMPAARAAAVRERLLAGAAPPPPAAALDRLAARLRAWLVAQQDAWLAAAAALPDEKPERAEPGARGRA